MPESDELQQLQATVLLCDAAQVVAGRLYVLGGGLNIVGPKAQGVAVAIQVLVPWDQANVRHDWTLELVDEDGRPVRINDKPILVKGQLEAGRPAGLRPGSPLPVSLAVNIPPLPFPGDRRYTFRFDIDGHTRTGWASSFSTRPQPAQAAG